MTVKTMQSAEVKDLLEKSPALTRKVVTSA